MGLLPVVTTFAVFCLRAIEQARLSLAYAKRNAKIVASHPGLDVGPDGGSAQSLEDLAAFRAIPGMTVISPADPVEMALATRAILEFDGPVYMRTGRSAGHARVRRRSHLRNRQRQDHPRRQRCHALSPAASKFPVHWKAPRCWSTDGISARVVNMATIKPIDSELLARCAEETGAIVTAEDHNIHGGLGGAVAESLAATRPCPIEFIGVKDVFGASGEPEELATLYGLTAPHIAKAATARDRAKGMNPMSRFSLAGKTAFVTGGSRGIGRAIAIGLAQAGADVALTYRENADEARNVVREIEALGTPRRWRSKWMWRTAQASKRPQGTPKARSARFRSS